MTDQNPADSNKSPSEAPRRDLMILALLLAFSSAGFVQKYAGLVGVVIYLVVMICAVFLAARLSARFAPLIQHYFRPLAGVFLAGCAVVFTIVYPIENNKGFGKSSDRDDGLNRAVARMVEGKTPYYRSDQHAGPLSVLPGSIAIAAPFAILGNSGYQNLFWLAVLLAAACSFFGDKALALCLVAIPFASSPSALYEFISGGDLLANGIFVAVFFLIALKSLSSPEYSGWHGWTACVLLGLGLASRPNFVLLLPLFGAVLWRRAGLPKAIAATGLAALVSAAVTVPFYLNDPAGFTPLMAKQKLAIVDQVLPWASMAMIGFTALTGLLGALFLLRHPQADLERAFFRWCAVVTLCPMLCAVSLSSMINSNVDFGFMRDRFGLMYVFFALFGWGGSLIPKTHTDLAESKTTPVTPA